MTPMRKLFLPFTLLFSLCVSGFAVARDDHASHHDAPAPVEMQGENQKQHGTAPAPSHEALLKPKVAVVVQEITLNAPQGTGKHRLYVAMPEKPVGKLPAVVLIHEWWGLNENIESMARLLAGEGYLVGAIDVYGKPATRDPAQAARFYAMATAKQAATTALVEKAADTLLAMPQAAGSQVGVMGWCFGGNQTLQAASRLPAKVKAAVVYYGIQLRIEKEISPIQAPVLGLYGAKDSLIPKSSIEFMHGELKKKGVATDWVIYDGAGHAFANPSAGNEKNYHPASAADAWVRTLAWLNKYLKG